MLGGQRECLALRGWERAAALGSLGLLAGRLSFREGACVEAWFAVGHDTRAFWFGGDRRRHLDWSLGSRLGR